MFGSHSPSRCAWRATLLGLAASLGGTAALCLIFFLGPREAHFSTELPPPAAGLYQLEHGAGGAFRWTASEAALDLPNPGGPLLITLQLAGDPHSTPVQLTGAVATQLAIQTTPRRYRLLLPAQAGERVALRLSAPSFSPAGERRRLGVQQGELTLRGGHAAPLVVMLAALLSAGALYGLLRTMLAPAAATFISTATVGAMLGLQALGRWTAGEFAALSTAACVLAALLLPARWLLPLVWERWRIAQPTRLAARPREFALISALGLYIALAYWNHQFVHPHLALDLGIYLEAGRLPTDGQSPYALSGSELVIGTAFVYPPAILPIFATMSRLEPATAAVLWEIVNALLFLLALFATSAALPAPISRSGLTLLLVLGVGFGPALESLAIGQINGLVLLGFALFMLGHSERRLAWLGDTALAVVILIKLTPGMLLLWPLARGDWTRLLRIAVALLALSLPSLLLYGSAFWIEFAILIPDLLRGVPRNPYNQALVGLLVVSTPHGSVADTVAALAGRAASLALVTTWAVVCWRWRRGNAEAVLAYGVAVLTVASSLIWYHHLTFLIIPLAWLGLARPAGRTSLMIAVVALAAVQSTRLVELSLGVPPWTAALGYLLVVVSLGFQLLAQRRSAHVTGL